MAKGNEKGGAESAGMIGSVINPTRDRHLGLLGGLQIFFIIIMIRCFVSCDS